MDRDTQRGQMIIEMVVIVLMFVGLFLMAVGISENGDQAQSQFRFSKPHSIHSRRFSP